MGLAFLALAGAILGFTLGFSLSKKYNKLQNAIMLAPLGAVLLPLSMFTLTALIRALMFLSLLEVATVVVAVAILVFWSEKFF